MFKQVAGLFKNSLIYGVQDVLEKAVIFLLIPVYTAYLTPGQYGIVSLMNLLISILSIFFLAGQKGAVLRFYHEYRDSPREKQLFLGSIFFYLLLAPLFLSLLLILWGAPLFDLVFQDISFYPYGFLAVLTAYFMVIPKLQLSVWIAGAEPRKYAFYAIAMFLLAIALILTFVVGFQWGALGKLLGDTLARGAFGLVTALLFFRYVKIKLSRPVLKQSLSYGLPLIPHLLAGIILSMSDRYMLEYFVGLTEVGLYSLGYNLGLIMIVIAYAFDKAWFPFFFSAAGSPEGEPMLARVATYYFTFSMFVTLFMVIFAREIVTLMAAPPYYQAYQVVPVVALGVFFHCVYYVPVKAFFYRKKTKIIPLLTGSAAAVNIGLNLLLIPRCGMLGAAWATVFSYMLMLILVFIFSQRLYYINYEWSRLMKGAAVSGAVFLLNLLIFGQIQVTLFQGLFIKGGLLLAGLLLLYPLGFFHPREMEKIKKLIFNKK